MTDNSERSVPHTTETVDPCERRIGDHVCGKPVYGYVARRCCDGRECGCMGLPIEPCWCEECWAVYTREAEERATAFRRELT